MNPKYLDARQDFSKVMYGFCSMMISVVYRYLVQVVAGTAVESPSCISDWR